MVRLLIIVIVLYAIPLCVFAIINTTLVLAKVRKAPIAIKSISTFSCFPLLVFTKEGRKKLKEAIKPINQL